MRISAIAIMLLLAILPACHAQKTKGLHIIHTFYVDGDGGWDYLAPGPVNDWLYVSHATQVNVLNKKTGEPVAVIENTTGVHGIAFDVANKKGFTSNGRLNTVTVFDMNSNKVLAQIATGQNPDAILYEPFSKKIITCNGRSKNLGIIDPVRNRVTDSVDVGGKPEEAVSDGMGKLFVNIEDRNEIVVVDTKSFKVLNRWSLAPGEGPTGLALDKTTGRLFAGCEKLLMVMDAANGKVIDQLPIGAGCDGVVFDAATKNIYTSNGIDGTITVVHEENAGRFVLVENVPTKKGARTIALDTETHLLYLPVADFEATDPGQKGRAKIKPGTFQVLVVAGQ